MKFHQPMWLIISLTLTLLLTGCDVFVDEQTRLAKAGDYSARGNHSAAIIELKKILKSNPGQTDARILLSEAWLKMGALAAAEYELRAAMEHQTGNQAAEDRQSMGKIMVLLARVLLIQNKYQEILESGFDQAITDQGGKIRMQVIYGNAYLGLQDADNALSAFKAAREISPDDVEAIIGMAHVYRAKGDSNKAVDVLDSTLSDKKDNIALLLAKSEFEFSRGRFAAAEESLHKALGKNPGEPLSPEKKFIFAVMLAEAQLQQNKIDACLETLNSIETKYAEAAPVAYLKALLAYTAGDYHNALTILQSLNNRFPEYSRTPALLGSTYFSLGDYKNAQLFLKKAVALEPDKSKLRKLLALTEIQLNEPENALSSLHSIIGETDSDPQILSLLGFASLQSGDTSAGIHYLQRSLAAEPGNVKLRIELARTYIRGGQYDKALSTLSAIDHSAAGHYEIETLKIFAHILKKDIDQAQANIGRLLEKQPDNATTFILAGTVCAAGSDPNCAYANFTKALELDPDNITALLAAARINLAQSRLNQAQSQLETVLKLDPGHAHALLALSKIAEIEQRPEEEIKWLEQLADSKPDSVQLQFLLLRRLLHLGKLDKAEDVLISLAKDIDTDTTPFYLASTKLVEDIPSDIESFNSQAKRYAWLINALPDNYIALNNLAWLYFEQADDRAETLAERAFQLQPGMGSIGDTYGWILVQQGKLKEGIEILKKADRQYPGNPDIRFHLAFALNADGKKSEAQSILDETLASDKPFMSREKAESLRTAILNSDTRK